MSLNAEQLYALLPAIYRTRDAENGEPLRALMTVIAEQKAILEENIQQLYDDEFIETCESWIVPYIGELIGYNPIYDVNGAAHASRAEVANTIGYRRRKGTVLALEQVAMDVSGRPAAAVEFFKRLITTTSMRHVRPHHAATADLRRGGQLERMDSAFDTLNRTVDVRRIAPRVRTISDPDPTPLDVNLHGGGRFNIPDVGMYLWRWHCFPVTGATAFRMDDRRYRFSPLGIDIPLFNALASRSSFSRLTTRLDVSQPIGRREFHASLDQFYGAGRSIEIFLDGVAVPVPQICCRNLSGDSEQNWGCTPPGKVAIDPELGRIQLAPDIPAPQQVQVNYCYGFPAEIGGGSYDRTGSLAGLGPKQLNFTAVVGSAAAPTLEAAIAAWNLEPPGSQGLIVLPGFVALDVDLTGAAGILLPAESKLWIVSGQLHPGSDSDFTYQNSCATLRGNVEVQGIAGIATESGDAPPAGQLSLSGIWISGTLTALGGPANIQLMDCTLVPGITLKEDGTPVHPGEPSLIVSSGEVSLSLIRCITGPVAASVAGTTRICSSILDAGSRCAVAYAAPDLAGEGADLHIEDSTVIGKVRVHLLELASNTIFLARLARHDSWRAALWCSRQQAGCVRFCFLPAGAMTPRKYRCLPDDSSQEDLFRPRFVSLRYGHPSYGLLSGDTPMAVWTGADNGSQMGVYYVLQETEAVRNVQLRAPEYLPFGLEDGIFLVPSRPEVIRPLPVVYGYGVQGNLRNLCGDQGEGDLRFVGVGAALI
ncbi:MAG: hypothetical protein P8Z30_05385 [Acidobacteriota bacterium]